MRHDRFGDRRQVRTAARSDLRRDPGRGYACSAGSVTGRAYALDHGDDADRAVAPRPRRSDELDLALTGWAVDADLDRYAEQQRAIDRAVIAGNDLGVPVDLDAVIAALGRLTTYLRPMLLIRVALPDRASR
jgi:hypothetical protein